MKAFLFASARMCVPYALAALGGLLSERAGVVNLALEGIMLTAALATAWVALTSGDLWLGVVAGMGAGALVAALYWTFAVWRRADQVLLGIALNLGAIGATRFLLKLGFDSASNSPHIEGDAWVWPLVLLALGLGWLALVRGTSALRLTAAGDHPEALTALGLSVARHRLYALLGCGLACGLAGAELVASQRQFSDQMTAGRGYIAVAAVVFGGWRFWPTMLACAIFAAAEALELRLQGLGVLPPQLAQALPYVLCILALLVRRRQLRAPLALGQ